MRNSLLGPSPRHSDARGLGWSLVICIFQKLSTRLLGYSDPLPLLVLVNLNLCFPESERAVSRSFTSVSGV